MSETVFDGLRAEIGAIEIVRRIGRIAALNRGGIEATGLSGDATQGDRVRITGRDGQETGGEILGLDHERARVLPDTGAEGLAIGDAVALVGRPEIAPDQSWIGRIVDAFGRPLDGRPLFRGPHGRALRAPAPAAAVRRRLGARLETGVRCFNTLLPLVRGQRLGVFAGSGVGKSSLLAKFARGVEADVVVIALIGDPARSELTLGTLGEDLALAVDVEPPEGGRQPDPAPRDDRLGLRVAQERGELRLARTAAHLGQRPADPGMPEHHREECALEFLGLAPHEREIGLRAGKRWLRRVRGRKRRRQEGLDGHGGRPRRLRVRRRDSQPGVNIR